MVAVIVGSSTAAVDLVAAGLVAPQSVQDADCEHGFESASFVLEDQMPHVRAHHAIVEGAPVKIYRSGVLTFEGTIVSVDDTGVTHEVECAGIYEQLKRREDYCAAWLLSEPYDQFVEVSPWVLGWDQKQTLTVASVDLDGQILISVPIGTAAKANQSVGVGFWLLSGLNRSLTIKRVTFDLTLSPGTAWYGEISTAPDLGYGISWRQSWSAQTDTQYDLSITWDCRFLGFDLRAIADTTTTAERYVQIRNLKIYVGRTSAPRVDEIITEIACPSDGTICTASQADSLGSGVSGFAVEPFTSRADAIEQARALYAGIIDVGVWENATLRVRARPTSPPSTQRHYAIRASNLPDPDAWEIARDTEAGIDAVCVGYELVPINELAQVAQVSFTSSTWPTSWARTTTTNNTIESDSGAYKMRVKSNATERNPYNHSAPMPVIGGMIYLARVRAYVGSYPGSGTAQCTLGWYSDAGGNSMVAETAVKSWAAADATEAWREALVSAPANAVSARWKNYWYGVTGGTGDYSLWARDFELQAITPAGTHKKVYYPSEPSAADARVALLEIGPATDAEAAAAAQQVYSYRSQLATGSCTLSGTVETMAGAIVPVEHIRSWDWVTKVDASDVRDRGPFMLSRVERAGDGTVTIEVGGDYWQHPGFQHGGAAIGRYVGERRVRVWKWVRKKVKGRWRRVRKPAGWRTIPGGYV